MKPPTFQNGILEAFTFRAEGKVENHQDDRDGMVFFEISGWHLKAKSLIKTLFSVLRFYRDFKLSEVFIFQKSVTLTDEELV